MSKFKLFTIAILAILLSACAIPPKSPEPTISYVVVKPSTDMVNNCSVSTPPEIDGYVSASADKQKKYLTNYSSSLLNDLTICNAKWTTLRQWYEDQIKIYEKKK